MNTNEVKTRLVRGLKDLQNFLRTNEGKNAMMVFEAKYGGSVSVPGDPYETHRRIGEKEVMEYLLQLRDGDNV